MPKQRQPGKFWPRVRAIIWQKAQELYQMEQAKTMGEDFKSFHKSLRANYKQKKGVLRETVKTLPKVYSGHRLLL